MPAARKKGLLVGRWRDELVSERRGKSFRGWLAAGLIVVGLSLPTNVVANGGIDTGWSAVFGANPAAETTEIQKVLGSLEGRRNHTWGVAKNAEALAFWGEGRYSEAGQSWLELVEWAVEPVPKESDSILRGPEFLEAYLAALEDVHQYVRVLERAIPLYETLMDLTEDDSKVRLLREYLPRAYELVGDYDGFLRLAPDAGVIQHWTALVGPFGRCASTDLEHVFPPEKDPNAEDYSDGASRIAWRAPFAEPPSGTIDFSDFLDSVVGTAYAKTTLRSYDSLNAVLKMESRADFRIWWNGRLIASCDRRDLDLENPIRVPVKIEPGENHLLVKARNRGGAWSFRITVQPLDFGARWETAWEVGAPIPACHPDNVRFVAQRIRPGLANLATPPPLSPVSSGPSGKMGGVEVLKRFYLSILYSRDGRYEEAKQEIERLSRAYPDWPLPILLQGKVGAMESFERPGSKVRLENESRKCFERVLELVPGSIPASAELGKYFLRRQTYDQALEVLKNANKAQSEGGGEEVVTPQDPELAWACGLVYEGLDYDLEARNCCRVAIESRTGRPECWARLVSLLRQGGSARAALDLSRAGAGVFPGYFPLASVEARLSGQCGETDRGVERLSDWIAWHPNDATARESKASLLKSDDRLDDALAELERVRRIAPFDGKTFLDTALIYFSGSGWANEKDLALVSQGKEFLLEARKRIPQEPQVWKLIAEADRFADRLSNRKRQGSPIVFPDDAYDEDLLESDCSGLDTLPQEKANTVNLLDLMVVTLFPNGTRMERVHQSVLLKTKEGRDAYSDIQVPRDAEILTARTISPDNEIYQAEHITDTGSAKSVSMYGLEDDCVVDYVYRKTYAYRPPPGYSYSSRRFYFGEYDNPTLLAKYILLVPSGVNIEWRANPSSFAPEVSREGEWTIYTWRKDSLPGVKSEARVPDMSLVVPTVEFTVCPDWSIGMENAKASLKGRIEDDGSLRELASLLSLGAGGRKDEIAAVHDYVSRNIEPNQFGGGTTLDTLKNRAGGLLDRTVLARALLEEMGIVSYLTEVYDVGTGKRFPPLPGAAYLGRPHLSIPGDSEPGFFPALSHSGDMTVSLASRYASVDEIADPKLEEGLRFHFTPQGAILAPPLSSVPTRGWIERHIEVDLIPDADAAGCRARFYYDGAIRASLKQAIVDQNVREQIVAAEATRTLRGFQLKSGEFEGVDDFSSNLAIRVEGEVKGFLEPAQKGARFDPIPDKSNLAGNTREPERVHPLQFNDTVVYNPVVAVFRLPQEGEGSDWVFSRVPEDVFLITRFGYYSLDYEIRGSELWVLRAAYVPNQWIDPEDYPEFQDFCRSVDAAEGSRVEIAPWSGLE